MNQEYDIKLTQAIRNLKADTEFSWGGESPDNAENFKKIKWITYENGEAVINTINPHSELTWTKVKAEMDRLDAEYDSLAYSRAREELYPVTKEFMEAYTEKEIGGDSTKWDAYVTKYNKVRSDNPNP